MKLEDLRREIDRIDDEIAALLERRMNLAMEVARVKIAGGAQVHQPAREAEVLARLCAAKPGMKQALKTIYGAVFQASLAQQHCLFEQAEE